MCSDEFVGTTYDGSWDGWYESSEGNWTYSEMDVVGSTTGRAMASIGLPITPDKIRGLRAEATLSCDYPRQKNPCKPLEEACLFDVLRDPCEFNNLAEQ